MSFSEKVLIFIIDGFVLCYTLAISVFVFVATAFFMCLVVFVVLGVLIPFTGLPFWALVYGADGAMWYSVIYVSFALLVAFASSFDRGQTY